MSSVRLRPASMAPGASPIQQQKSAASLHQQRASGAASPTPSNLPGSRGAAGGAAESDELRRELDYTRDVLKRYREYVQQNYDKKLQDAADDCAVLQHQLEDARAEAADLRGQLQRGADDARRAAAAEEQRERHVATITETFASEREALQRRVREAEAVAAPHAELIQRAREEAASDAAAELQRLKRRVDALEAELATAQRKSLAQSSQLDDHNAARQGFAAARRTLFDCIRSVAEVAAGARDGSAQVALGFTHAGISDEDTAALSAAWARAAQAAVSAAEEETSQGPAAADRAADGLAAAASAQRVLDLIAALGKAAAGERVGTARAVRQLLGDREALEAELRRKEAAFQAELELQHQRLAELEDDRRLESGAVALQRRAGMLAAAPAGGAAAVRAHSMLVHSSDAAARAAPASTGRRAIAVQTGVELMRSASIGAGRTARLESEVADLQEQLAKAREAVRLLDQQRRQFMYFVDDSRLEEDVARALGAGFCTTDDFVRSGGVRFRMLGA